jgi:hypothetical protein
MLVLRFARQPFVAKSMCSVMSRVQSLHTCISLEHLSEFQANGRENVGCLGLQSCCRISASSAYKQVVGSLYRFLPILSTSSDKAGSHGVLCICCCVLFVFYMEKPRVRVENQVDWWWQAKPYIQPVEAMHKCEILPCARRCGLKGEGAPTGSDGGSLAIAKPCQFCVPARVHVVLSLMTVRLQSL